MDKYYCCFCNKEFKSAAGKNGHQPTCKQNPNKIEAWNKGLTKETSEILKKVSEKIKKTQNSDEWIETIGKRKKENISINKMGSIPWNKGLTKETSDILKRVGEKNILAWKNKSEEEMKKFRKSQRDITVKRISEGKNRKYTNTKPERRFKKFLKSLNIKYKQNYPIFSIKHSYPCDFYLPDYNTIIEVDGERWHNFPLGREIDNLRTIELENEGYKVFRIWSECIDLLEEIPDIFLNEYLKIQVN